MPPRVPSLKSLSQPQKPAQSKFKQFLANLDNFGLLVTPENQKEMFLGVQQLLLYSFPSKNPQVIENLDFSIFCSYLVNENT